MKNKLYKIFIATMSVLIMLEAFPSVLTSQEYTTPFIITAQAASKKTHLKKQRLL